MTISGVTVSNNQSQTLLTGSTACGGGVEIRMANYTGYCGVSIDSSSFTGNSTQGVGGGICQSASARGEQLSITNSVITGNSSVAGGGPTGSFLTGEVSTSHPGWPRQ